MALLNLILLPLLAVLGLFTPDGDGGAGGDGGGAGTSGSATPPATGAGGSEAPAGGEGTTPPTTTTNGGDEPLGEGGKRALESERSARRNAERDLAAAKNELEQLRTANQTEAEKAISDAKKAGKAEADGVWQGRFLRAEAKSALAAAGVGDIDVAVAAFLDAHRDLKVDDNGQIEGLDATVKAFKQAHPTLFTARVPGGSADQGAKPPSDKRASSLEEAYERHYAPQRTQ